MLISKKLVVQGAEFGLSDYWRMFNAKGINLPWNYFFQAHAFDLIHGTDTHSRAIDEAYRFHSGFGDSDSLYRCSWTKEIRLVFNVLRDKLGHSFERHSFVDIGCGKGKVVLAWAIFLKRLRLRQRIVGLDNHEAFIWVAKNNQKILGFSDRVSFLYDDAVHFDYQSFGPKIIAYLYNPFGKEVLRKVLARLSEFQAVIVYNNPVHADEILSAGYKPIWVKHGWHPNCQTTIFSKPSI